MKLVRTLPSISGISPDMFSPHDLRGLAGQESKIINNQMSTLHVSYLRWKQCRKANESIPDLIRHSIYNLKPITKENPRIFRSDFQNISLRYVRNYYILT